MFVTKLDPAGTRILASTYLGGSNDDDPQGIALDPSGAAYVTGLTSSTNYPATTGAFESTAPGNGDTFVSKLNAPPITSSQPATGIRPTVATLAGTVNPNGASTSYSFEYGTSTTYGSHTATQAAGSDDADHGVTASVIGLTPRTTYHFRIVATNAGNNVDSGDETFTTPAAPAAPKLRLIGHPHGASVTLACQAASGAVCRTTVQLTTVEHVKGGHVVGVSARARSKRVTIGSKRLSIKAGAHVKLTVPLNRTGRRLLARFHKLPARLKITLAGASRSAIIARVTIHSHR